MTFGRRFVEPIDHSALWLDADKTALSATVIKYPMIKFIAYSIIVVSDDGLMTACEVVAVDVNSLGGASGNVFLFLIVEVNI